jgi:hypothetical protein
MAKGFGIGKQLDRNVSSALLIGAIKAAERTVDELQEEGPSWTGRFSNSWQMVDVKTVVVEGIQAAVTQKASQVVQPPWTGLQLLQKEAA